MTAQIKAVSKDGCHSASRAAWRLKAHNCLGRLETATSSPHSLVLDDYSPAERDMGELKVVFKTRVLGWR